MYNQYKCIKKYPFGPKVGTITNFDETIKDLKIVSEYPEFWELIIEKEWEILEVRGYSGDYVVQKDGSFYFMGKLYGDKSSGMDAYNYLNSKLEHHIHSVRRLSDGVIFSIGDKVFETITGKKDSWIIKEFSLKDSRCFSCGININNIEKHKEPLFITEDKVEIFKGDLYFYVDDCFDIVGIRAGITSGTNGFKYFSNEKTAKDWIDLNKPKYSLQDIQTAMIDVGFNASSIISAKRRLLNFTK